MAQQSSTVTEIERCAITMLARAESYHPAVTAWVQQIVADPSYSERLDGTLADAILEHDRETVNNGMDERLHRQACAQQEGTYRLASAIVEYRRDGRQDGDRTSTLMGLGSPLAIVTTSLTATIVEYHLHIVNSYAIELEAATNE